LAAVSNLKSGRTVVASGVPDVLPPDRIADKLTIHFQSPRRSCGGDVEEVKYPTSLEGVAVLLKCHTNFSNLLRATVDLSMFGSNQESLMEKLRSAHRSLRFRPSLQERKASIEGPFAAVQALRKDLICRASRLQSAVTARPTAINLRESPLNPVVISHRKYVSPVSHSSSKWEPASSLSTSLQSTGEAREIQSLLSKSKPQNASLRQKVSSESLAGGRISGAGIDKKEDKLRVRSRLEMSSEYRTEQRQANHREVADEEIKARITSSLLGLPQEEAISTKESSEKHPRPGKISAIKTGKESDLGSQHSSTGYLKNRSSSAVRSKLLQTGLEDISQTSERYTEGTAVACAICPEAQDVIWVDSYTFRYIEKFHKKELDRCLGGTDMSVMRFEESDLMRISLTERQNSKAPSGIQKAAQQLEALMESWQSTLRVYEIFYDEAELLDKDLMNQICHDVNFLFDDVLCLFEGSCIKVIGPSVSSILFYKRVKDRMSKAKVDLVNSRSNKSMYFNH
uniref:Uncharacterized protein n=1 Tax=Amphilophus citrinellus TaxID=61819 RepID=A0A3Q0SMP9_AMPCI